MLLVQVAGTPVQCCVRVKVPNPNPNPNPKCFPTQVHWFACLSVYELLVFSFCPLHCTVCPLDAQHLTEALVAVEDLDLRLEESSIEAVEELLLIPTLRQLTLHMVSDHVSPLSVLLL